MIADEKSFKYIKDYKFRHYLFLGILLIAGLLLFTIFYWLLYPYNVLEIETPIPIVTPYIFAGEKVYYNITYCKYTDKPALVRKVISNDFQVGFPPIITNAKIGCNNAIATLLTPDYLQEGDYKIMFSYEYQINPIRKITIYSETDYFNIKEK